MAQLVAHLLCKQGVRGSSPLGSTKDVPLTYGNVARGTLLLVLQVHHHTFTPRK